ncbi:hypothetical protein [Streptomyces sp. NPDC047079]
MMRHSAPRLVTAASQACGLAAHSGQLIAFRLVQEPGRPVVTIEGSPA